MPTPLNVIHYSCWNMVTYEEILREDLSDALMSRMSAVIMCMIMPTNGIHAIHEVTTPTILPDLS